MDKRFSPNIVGAAQRAQSRWRVPAAVTLAQWAIESGFGAHMPADSNNPFGIKARAGEPHVETMTTEFLGGRYVRLPQAFRKFATLADAFDAHGELIATSHFYTKAMAHTGDPKAFADALTGVYATDPHYGAKLIALMTANGLQRFDISPAAAKPAIPKEAQA